MGKKTLFRNSVYSILPIVWFSLCVCLSFLKKTGEGKNIYTNTHSCPILGVLLKKLITLAPMGRETEWMKDGDSREDLNFVPQESIIFSIKKMICSFKVCLEG